MARIRTIGRLVLALALKRLGGGWGWRWRRNVWDGLVLRRLELEQKWIMAGTGVETTGLMPPRPPG
ncbi:hypothetical protein SCLCIDRAFT_1206541 [Scleroderma citrinum Foug A]|uniref:Uncharacterized protein n=1 Tax=Scleroderma citrinum Foug A TaxID=1036808 RepID=A0A0C2ZQE6_9AGAM|nr:hypothetical protein SCLCIDRAFT_1213951 [Scleroderma citrinum Foug A]KIM70414.1 hypothetical protein SCLCIDRAFT_1206541 [Scleroderma citrinum Foug A]